MSEAIIGALERFNAALDNEEYDIAEYELDIASPVTDDDRRAVSAARSRLRAAVRDLPNDY